MSRLRFSSGARFLWRNATCQVVRLLPDEQAHIENILTGAVSVVEISTLVHALFAGELCFVSEHVAASPRLGAEKTPLSLSDYPEELVWVARYRLEAIRPLLELERRTRAAVLARVLEIKTVQSEQNGRSLQDSVILAAIYRWIGD